MRPLFAAIAATLFIAQPTQGEDFRVQTRILEGEEVLAEIMTVFYQGRVYDLSDPKRKEFTVFDPKYQRISLIDMNRKVKTEVQTEWLRRFTLALKERAPTKYKNAYFINPNFKEEIGDNLIRLTSPKIGYEVTTTQARWPEAVTAYRTFTDWYCQLNATNTKNLPPFPRLALNAALARQNALPQTVRLRLPNGSKQRLIVAEHKYFWMLSRNDREFCETIGGHLANDQDVRKVDFHEYRKSERVALGSSANKPPKR